MALLPVEEARARSWRASSPLPAKPSRSTRRMGRVLAAAAEGAAQSAAIRCLRHGRLCRRAADVAATPVSLKVIGMSAAGHAFAASCDPAKPCASSPARRCRKGADTVVIQENTAASRRRLCVDSSRQRRWAEHPRAPGSISRKGDDLLPGGIRLNARDIGLAAAANAASSVYGGNRVASVRHRRRIGAARRPPGADQIISSNSHALMAMARHFGADVIESRHRSRTAQGHRTAPSQRACAGRYPAHHRRRIGRRP